MRLALFLLPAILIAALCLPGSDCGIAFAQKPGAQMRAVYGDSLRIAVGRRPGVESLPARIELMRYLGGGDVRPFEEKERELLKVYSSGLRIAERANAAGEISKLHRLTALFYRREKKPETALDYANLALEAAEEAGDLELKYKAGLLRTSILAQRGSKDDFLQALVEAETLLEETRRQNVDSLYAKQLQHISSLYKQKGRYQEAAALGLRALATYEKIGFDSHAMIQHMRLGELYAQAGDNARYAEHIGKYFNYAEKLALKPEKLAGAYLRAGNAFRENQDYARALEYYFKSEPPLKARKTECKSPDAHYCIGAYRNLATLYYNIGGTYGFNEAYDTAVAYFEKGIELFEAINKTGEVATGKLYAARFRRKQGKPREAAADLSGVLNQFESVQASRMKMLARLELGLAYADLKQFQKAKPLLYQPLRVYAGPDFTRPDTTNFNDFQNMEDAFVEGFRALSGVYQRQGKSDSAYFAYKAAAFFEQFALRKRLRAKEQELLNRFDLREKEKEISSLQTQNKASAEELQRQRMVAWAVSIGLLLIGGVLFITWRNYKAKKRANSELARQKAELSNAYEEIRSINDNLSTAYGKIEKQNLDLTDSMTYARQIQQAALPRREYLDAAFGDYFLYYRPRDIISGDFYWFAERDGLKFIAVCDCTGHGVPGALMSILGASRLNLVINDLGVLSPETILAELDARLTAALQQEVDGEVKDSIDLALCVIDPRNKTLKFSGAGRPLWHVRGADISEIKGARCSTGGSQFKDKSFFAEEIDYAPGDRIYLFSDGVTDQFGGEKKRKFGPRRLREFIMEHRELSLKEQGKQFTQKFGQWHQSHKQLDDITLLAVELARQA